MPRKQQKQSKRSRRTQRRRNQNKNQSVSVQKQETQTYSVRTQNAPVSKGTVNRNIAPPQMLTSSEGVVVRHKELWNLVTHPVAGTFNAVFCDVNPGLTSTIGGGDDTGPFTWLPNIARNYTRYRVRKCQAEYVPTSATSADGTVGMVNLYNVNSTVPANITEAINSFRSVSGPTWQHSKIDLVTSGAMTQPRNGRLIRQATIGSNAKPDYDFGKLVFFSECPNAGQSLGQLWVTYEIEFMIPIA